MERFFLKKECFAVCFLLFVLGFGVVNVVYNRASLASLAEDFRGIETVSGLEAWIDDAEDAVTEDILGRMAYVETYGCLQKVMGKREFNNFAYIQDEDDMLYYGSVMELDTDDLEEYAGNVQRLNAYVESQGGKLLVVIPPSKVLAGVSGVNREWPINNPANRVDKLMLLLQQYGVNAVDLSYAMQESGEELDALFFKTDHHWTPLAAFYGMSEVVEQMNVRFGAELDTDGYYRNLDNYNSSFYEQVFLGSTGRNTGVSYSGLDDYLLLWPECDMEFTWMNLEDDEETSGTFAEALLDLSALTDIEDIYDSNGNKVYIEQVVDQDIIINRSNPEGVRLTVLRDSYFSPMACFMAPMCSEISMLWTRNSEGIDMEEFIRESTFDYVILEVYPYNLDEQSFDFFHDTGE